VSALLAAQGFVYWEATFWDVAGVVVGKT